MLKIKRFGKVLALTLALSMLMTTAVFAEDPVNEEDYVVTYSAEEVTDVDELIAMAIEQKAEQPQSRAHSAMPAEDNGQLNVTQVLEVREYADGSIEKDMIETAIMPSKELAEKFATQGSTSHLQTDTWVVGYIVTGRFYFSYRQASDGSYEYRADKIVTGITRNSNAKTTISNAYHQYRVKYDSSTNPPTILEKRQNITYNNSAPTGLQTFTLTSSHTGYYPSAGPTFAPVYGVGGETSIDFADGNWITLHYYAGTDWI